MKELLIVCKKCSLLGYVGKVTVKSRYEQVMITVTEEESFWMSVHKVAVHREKIFKGNFLLTNKSKRKLRLSVGSMAGVFFED